MTCVFLTKRTYKITFSFSILKHKNGQHKEGCPHCLRQPAGLHVQSISPGHTKSVFPDYLHTRNKIINNFREGRATLSRWKRYCDYLLHESWLLISRWKWDVPEALLFSQKVSRDFQRRLWWNWLGRAHNFLVSPTVAWRKFLL